MNRIARIVVTCGMLLSLFVNVGEVLAQGAPSGKNTVGEFIPGCLIDPPTGQKEDEGMCRSISIFLILLINIARYLFTIVGALALLFFVYGGFVLILSRGNSEQTSKGIGIITAAVIGLVIVFSAYMLVAFLGSAIGLKGEYTLIL